jgi:hypothetical protein
MRISDSFKFFNPLWLVQNVFTTHIQPILVGAGVGALSSAAMGKSPFTGALLGGATGGLFGGSESLLGSKFADAFGQGAVGGVSKGIVAPVGELAKQGVSSVGVQNIGQFANPLANVTDDLGASLTGKIGISSSGMPSTGIPLSTGDLAGGVGNNALTANMSKLFNYTPPTAFEKIQGVGTDAYTWAKDNPLSAGNIGLKGFELANQPPKPVDTSAQRPVRQGTYEGGAGVQLTPAASNVSPQILPVKPNKTGQIALDSVVQKHPELINLYPNLFGGR